MPLAVDLVAVLTRFLHVGSACLLTGTFAFLVLVGLPASRARGPETRGGFDALDRRLLALAGIALGIAMATGLLDLARQAFVATPGGAAAGLWAGALVPLVLFLTGASIIPAAVAVRHFSTLALVSVGIMLVSGAYAAFEQVGSVPALVGTLYGRWLLAKLALLLPLLGIAFVNRAHLRPG